MSVESDIFDTLKALVSNRVYPDSAPSGAAKPYITYTQVGGDAINYTEGTVPNRKNGVFQVNVWAQTRSEASALMLAVEAALMQATVFAVEVQRAPINEYEPDIPIYGAHQDFSIWSVR